MTRTPWWPWRWSAWAWLALIGAIFFVRFPIHFALTSPYLMDFQVYRTVGERVAAGAGAQLYVPTATGLMFFKYAPCWALAWVPFAWLPIHTGAVAWSALTVLWLTLSAWGSLCLCRDAGLRCPGWLHAVAPSLLVRPLTAEFLNGQVDLLWGGLTIGGLLAARRQRSWWAAASLALAISLKLPAAVFLAYFALRGRWGLAVRTVALFVVLNAASALALDPVHPQRLLSQWIVGLWSSGSGRAFEIGNQSILTLAGRLLSNDGYRFNLFSLPVGGVVVAAASASLALFTSVLIAPSNRLGEPARLVFDGALLTVLMVVCSPTVWIANYSALILPVTVAAARFATDPRATWRHAPSWLNAAAVGLLSVLTHSAFWRSLGIRQVRNEAYVYLVFLVLPWLALALFAYLWSQRRLHGPRA